MSNRAGKLASTFRSPTPLKYINRDRPREKNAAPGRELGASVDRPTDVPRTQWIQKNEIRALAINLNQRVHLFSRVHEIDRRGMRMERQTRWMKNDRRIRPAAMSSSLLRGISLFILNPLDALLYFHHTWGGALTNSTLPQPLPIFHRKVTTNIFLNEVARIVSWKLLLRKKK